MDNVTDWVSRHFLILGIVIQDIRSDNDRVTKDFEVFGVSSPVKYLLRRMDSEIDPAYNLDRYLWAIEFAEDVSLREAHHYGHGVAALSTIIPFCIGQSVDDLLHVMPFPDEIAADPDKLVSEDGLAEVLADDLDELFWGESEFRIVFGTRKSESMDTVNRMIPYLVRFANDESFARGCSYLDLSMTELGVDVCDWREQDYDDAFYRYVSVARAESSFLNAYKAVELMVGEPSKNRTREKLVEKCKSIGLDPYAEVGYREKKSVVERIRDFQSIRDKVAAHGIAKYKRDILMGEIIEVQALARHMLLYSD